MGLRGWDIEPNGSHGTINAIATKGERKVHCYLTRSKSEYRHTFHGFWEANHWWHLHDLDLEGEDAYLGIRFLGGENSHRWRFYRITKHMEHPPPFNRNQGMTVDEAFP